MHDFKVTHYLPRPAEDGVWVPLPFITRYTGDVEGPYFFGFETFRPLSLNLIQSHEMSEEIKKLFPAHRIDPHQGLWLTPNYDIWLAAESDPIGDRGKIRLARGETRLLTVPMISPVVQAQTGSIGGIIKWLQESPVAQAILEAGVIPVQGGDYLNSKSQPGTLYAPAWEIDSDGIVGRVQQYLSEASNVKRIVPKYREVQEHSYIHIEHAMKANRIALLFEVIFETEERRNSINIVQLGNAPYLSIVYVQGSGAHKALQLKADEQYANTFNEWIQTIQDSRTNICAPDATAVDHLIWEAISNRELDLELTYKERSLNQLQAWISENKENGIIACDVGIAYQLMSKARWSKLDLRMSFVPYDQPIPVGIAFNTRDQAWGQFLEIVIREVFHSPKESIVKSITDTKERFRDLNLEWVYPAAA